MNGRTGAIFGACWGGFKMFLFVRVFVCPLCCGRIVTRACCNVGGEILCVCVCICMCVCFFLSNPMCCDDIYFLGLLRYWWCLCVCMSFVLRRYLCTCVYVFFVICVAVIFWFELVEILEVFLCAYSYVCVSYVFRTWSGGVGVSIKRGTHFGACGVVNVFEHLRMLTGVLVVV